MSRKQELRKRTIWRSDPHTLVKHMVYRHYLQCWMPKILQKFPTATIVDGFAGPGVYSDGALGSPLLVVRSFLDHAAHARFGTLRLVCLEQRPDRVERLNAEVAALGSTPRLQVVIQPPGEFADQQHILAAAASGSRSNTPVLWLLDPFNIKSLPFDAVSACLSSRYSEAIITFFTEEMHRFCTRAGFDQTLDAHYGSRSWRSAAAVHGEAERKNALIHTYREGLQARGLFTEQFGVQVRNATPRYSLIFATHSEYGLKCWNPMKWKLDSYSGSGASASSLGQLDLFGSSPDPLMEALRTYAGTEQTWAALAAEATRQGYLDRHLREALDALATEGVAIRVQPVDARTPWPEDSLVRFYTNEDVDEADLRESLDEGGTAS